MEQFEVKVFKIFRKWLRKDGGTTSIEFGLLFIPYLFLTLGIIELSVMYASASLLEGATNKAARLVRTGQLQQGGSDPETVFREAICDYATVLINCEAVGIEAYEMSSYSDFSDYEPQFDDEGEFVSQGFTIGGSNAKVLIRVAYNYNMLSPLVGTLLAGPDSKMLFMSTIVLQTEPYDFGEIS